MITHKGLHLKRITPPYIYDKFYSLCGSSTIISPIKKKITLSSLKLNDSRYAMNRKKTKISINRYKSKQTNKQGNPTLPTKDKTNKQSHPPTLADMAAVGCCLQRSRRSYDAQRRVARLIYTGGAVAHRRDFATRARRKVPPPPPPPSLTPR